MDAYEEVQRHLECRGFTANWLLGTSSTNADSCFISKTSIYLKKRYSGYVHPAGSLHSHAISGTLLCSSLIIAVNPDPHHYIRVILCFPAQADIDLPALFLQVTLLLQVSYGSLINGVFSQD